MGRVSTYRRHVLRWYVAFQEELAALRRGTGEASAAPPTPKQERIAAILRLRAEGKTQREVATIVGVSPGYISKLERSLLPGIIAYLAHADILDAATELLETIIR
jgi:DNA-binding CsgD family transcriptional regulator